MELLVTSQQMRDCDRIAIEKLGIPTLILMENAGAGVVHMIQKHYGPVSGRSFSIFCGKGNNGGDGLVVARHLFNQGARVLAVIVGRRGDLKKDARTNYECIRKLRASLHKADMLRITELASDHGLRALPQSDFIVDALLGTGFRGEVRGVLRKAIEWINARSCKRISIDLPSGVDADNGLVGNVAVQSDLTVTMGLKKIGLIAGKGRGYAGNLETVDIGVRLNGFARPNVKTFLVRSADVRRIIPARPFDAHKHSVGKILVLAGSRGLTGAAALTSASALRSGAGAVILGTPRSVYPILARKLTEVMVEPLPETSDGALGLDAYRAVEGHLRWADVLILGPGLSRNDETQHLVLKLISTFDKPMLIDADALNALAEKVSVLKRRKSRNIVMTPHTGELSRLVGLSAQEIERDRVSVARKTARQFRATLVLKGAPTVTSSETGVVFVNSTGNPGMATAGAGDVLAGVIGALWSQGMSRTEAAFSGAFIHGRAGDMAKNELGERAVMAMDIHRYLAAALTEIQSAQ